MNKAEKTRQFIVEKTAPIFNEKGYTGTSLNDMTNATGLTKGSIYGNFANKDEVAMASFDYNMQQVQQLIRQEVSRETTCKNKLLAYVKVYDQFLKYPFPAGGCPILNTAVEADDTHPSLKQKASDAFHTWKDAIAAIISKGITTREFHAHTDPEQAAVTMIALIEGAIMISKLTGKLQYKKTILQSVEKLIARL
ncbi:TetR/AcrR family transcriptional regulator [Chitinophaga nivalis]|uniref:TetR/AcrR family transcriptional regulator n=1 Tax=Chitinophaga nivalis TaxID=2991709 RepID=A0ABT3IML4_9BACT|nr:TetR/AcrR family transcriptional regulator [Chitinophaga nivalis]MCW3465110.1 TetR/AcrR family transcriptional regulator [Chitinophaga nivalis]MCW3485198.1 TetR/AcrR family transcriptional regulator [Chitinophaga nivalis]